MVTNLPAELLNVQPLDLLAGLGEEDQLWGFSWDLLEHCALELRLEVPVDEVLHLRELQSQAISNTAACIKNKNRRPCSVVIQSRIQ